MDLTNATGEIGTATLVIWRMIIEFVPRFAAALLIFVIGVVIARAAGRGLSRLLGASGRIDQTFRSVLAASARYAIMIVVIIAVLGQLGVETASLLAALAGAGLAIGLALQGTLSNIAAGLMLLWLRPFRVGEYIDANGIAGTVKEVGLFVTLLDTYDGVYRFVPNSELWNKQVLNYTRNPSRMMDVRIGIAYESDIGRAKEILLDLAESDARTLDTPAPEVFVDNLGDSAVVLAFRAWIRTADFWPTQRHLVEAAKREFDAAGIAIPFPQRVLHVATGGPLPFGDGRPPRPSSASQPTASND
jgi:small conductance mechanosensitive channel